jgi:hypothetical protein
MHIVGSILIKYRCFSWTYKGQSGNQSITGESVLFGWGQGKNNPSKPSDPSSPIDFHDNGFGVVAVIPHLAANPSYDAWASNNQPPKTGSAITTTAASQLSGNNTAWPVFPKISGAQTPVVVTTFGTAVPKSTTTTPVLPSGWNAVSSSQVLTSSQTSRASRSPKMPAATPKASSSGPTTIMPSPFNGGTNPPGSLPTITRTNPPSPNNSGTHKGDDDGWADKRVIHVEYFAIDPIVQEKRQLPSGPPKIPVPTSTASTPVPDQVPPPADDLGLFPKMSGVPNKPPTPHGGGSGGYPYILPPIASFSKRQIPSLITSRPTPLASIPQDLPKQTSMKGPNGVPHIPPREKI